MTVNESFHTREGRFRILVEQRINGETVDWYLVERRTIKEPDELVAHKTATEQFVGREVRFIGPSDSGGYIFHVKRSTPASDAVKGGC